MDIFLTNITHLQEFEALDIPIENLRWITAKHKAIFVREMSTNHIQNCINCWNGKGKSRVPTGYLGGKEKWLKIFNQELLNRQ